MNPKVLGVETADHPTGREIVARAKNYFTESDRVGYNDHTQPAVSIVESSDASDTEVHRGRTKAESVPC